MAEQNLRFSWTPGDRRSRRHAAGVRIDPARRRHRRLRGGIDLQAGNGVDGGNPQRRIFRAGKMAGLGREATRRLAAEYLPVLRAVRPPECSGGSRAHAVGRRRENFRHPAVQARPRGKALVRAFLAQAPRRILAAGTRRTRAESPPASHPLLMARGPGAPPASCRSPASRSPHVGRSRPLQPETAPLHPQDQRVFRACLGIKRRRSCLRPYYFVGESSVSCGGALATICPDDKKLLHGMRDAILAPTGIDTE